MTETMTSEHADLLNTLDDMASSPAYALRRNELRQAEKLIADQERDLKSLSQQLAAAKQDRNTYCDYHRQKIAELVHVNEQLAAARAEVESVKRSESQLRDAVMPLIPRRSDEENEAYYERIYSLTVDGFAEAADALSAKLAATERELAELREKASK